MNSIQAKAGAYTGAQTAVAPNAQMGAGVALNTPKDRKEAETAAQFGDVWKDMQVKYGAKAEKPREIKKQLGKDDFLRIMVTQMKFQDPTSPFKAEQFAAEMAQFASVEQLQNINSNLNKMGNQNQPLERLAMTNLIGKTVTVDRDRFPHTEGTAATLNYTLPADAKEVHVSVVSETGETLWEQDLGKQKAGENRVVWDGLKGGTALPAKSGTYILSVRAQDEREQAIPISSRGSAKILGVSFEGSEPVFLVGDVNHPDKITMRNVVRIDEGGMNPSAVVPGAKSLADASAQHAASSPSAGFQPAPSVQPQGPSFFTFEKGKGSSNLDESKLDPEARAAIGKYVAQQNAAKATDSAESEKVSSDEKGFPNGLSGSESDEEAQAVN